MKDGFTGILLDTSAVHSILGVGHLPWSQLLEVVRRSRHLVFV